MIGGLVLFGVQNASAPFLAPEASAAAPSPWFAITHGAARAIVAPSRPGSLDEGVSHDAAREPNAPTRHQDHGPGPRQGRHAMLRHHRMVLALFQAAPILPARFNSRFDGGVSAARRWLDARHDEILARLEAVAGCVEVGYRLTPIHDHEAPAAEPPAARGADALGALTDGARYLRTRRAALHREASADAQIVAAAARLEHALAGDARAVTQRWRATPAAAGGVALVGAVLTPAHQAAAMMTRIAKVQSARAGVRVTATGPYPPYSFADLDTPLERPEPARARPAARQTPAAGRRPVEERAA